MKTLLSILLLWLSFTQVDAQTPAATTDAETVVQAQLDAYNARDIEAFMETYADSVELYEFPNTLISKGKEGMRKNYKNFFDNTPNLYCELKKRMVLGNKVIDQEHVRMGQRYLDAIAVYEVKNGKIIRVTFISNN